MPSYRKEEAFSPTKRLKQDKDALVHDSNFNEYSQTSAYQTETFGFPIAVTGIGCRMPGGVNSPESFWEVISEGRDTVTEIPKERWNINEFYDADQSKSGKMVTRRAGFVDDVDQFDHGFFKISPREAASMDPQQRLLLEVVEEAFEDAGIDPDTLKTDCGVFVGIGMMDYGMSNVDAYHMNPYTITGNAHSVAANRISYAFNLQGPSYAVDTACAASMTAMHLACTHLWNKECKVAVVSGCNSLLIPEVTVGFSALGVLSPEGRCCPFSDEAKGYVRSEGWGSLILKPLSKAVEDGDHIYSVIRGSAIAANGFCGSLTMPLQAAQEYVMHEAYDRFNLSMSSVDYVEAHGTGTPVGDPIEARAIGNAFGPHIEAPLKIGSVKSNFAHNECAAGITATIKASLMLANRTLCPTINHKRPNPAIDLEQLKLQIQTTKQPFLPNKKYRFGVNSFGFAGAVAHLVIEEPPNTNKEPSHVCGWKFGSDDEGEELLIPLSAKSKEAVDDLARKWLSFQHEDDALGIIAWQATRKKHHESRMAITAKSGEEFRQSLEAYLHGASVESVITGTVNGSRTPSICFVFPGQGQQWGLMGRNLYATEEVFREVINQCDAIFKELSGWSLLDDAGLLNGMSSSKTRTNLPVNSENIVDEMEVSQPVILFFQIGLFHLVKHWGINPAAVVGHSLGEVAAAYACGGMTMEEAVTAIYHRSTQQAKLKGAGGMAALRHSNEDTEKLCEKYENLYIAAINAPGSVTIAGDIKEIEEITTNSPQHAKQLRVQCAFHTPYMDPIEKDFLRAMDGVVKTTKRRDSVPFYSTVDGSQYNGSFAGSYWWKNIRNKVSFSEAVMNMINEIEPDVIIEIGASATLLSSVNKISKETSGSKKILTVGLGQRGKDDRHSLLRAAGTLYTAGVAIDWSNVTYNTAKWAPIPTYPWQHHTHWTEPEDRIKLRLGLEDKSFKGQNGNLSLDVFPYLADHVVENKVVFPGAGYIEYSVEMFFGENENPALKNMRFLRALIWPQDDRTGRPSRETILTQASKEGSSIHIMCGETLHYKAEMDTPASTDEIYQCLQIAKIKQRCEVMVSGIEIYQKLASIGLQYGPNFQVIQQLMLGDGESIAVMRNASDTKQRVQATLLDGCFQLVIASLGQFTTAYLPIKLDMLQMTVPTLPLDEQLIAYAKVTDCDSTSITGDAFLCTSNGRVLMKVAGLMAKSLQDSNSGVDLESCLCTTEWQSVRSCLPPTNDVCTVFEEASLSELFPSDMHIVQRTEAIMPTIKKICKSYIKHGLDMVDESKIGDRNERYIKRLRAIADDTTVETLSMENVHKAIDDVTVMIPEISQELKMIKTLGDALPDTLKDPDIGVSLLFAPDSLALYFADAPTIRLFYKAGAEAIARAVEKTLTQKKVVRILEVGGRMGGLSKYILSLMKEKVESKEVEYIFTDLSASFFSHAQQCLEEFPSVKYKQLDIEKDIESQGFIAGSVDIVVCLDTLHSAVDVINGLYHMQNLLCEDGWLFMYEGTNSNYMSELVFGSLQLCWVYEDFRQESCWLTRQGWEDVVKGNGFNDVVSVSTPNELMHSIVIGRKVAENGQHAKEAKEDKYMLLGCADETVKNCIRKSTGKSCSMVNMPRIEDIESYCKVKVADIIYWCGEWDADLHFLLALLKAMDCHEENIRAVYIVTQGTHKQEGNVWSHAVFGLAGSVCNHINSGSVYYVDLDSESSLQQNAQVLCRILTDPSQPERALVIKGNEVFCQRIINAEAPNISPKNVKYWRLEQSIHHDGKSTSLDDVGFCALQNLTPKPGKVVVKVQAAALNFKDVMMAHGMLEGLEVDETRCRFGLECSGVVEEVGDGVDHLRVGDEVIAFTKTSFASHVTSDARFVIPKPKHLSMMDSASITVAFTTAYHSLVERANLQEGETVLIHSACGGVGLSAIQIAKMQGAIVMCTAGTEEKREYLRKELGIKYVTDSRSDRFYHDVMKWTNGEGVNVILNSLYGRLMERGLASLASGGRFCEIGKRDILENSQLDLKTFLENKSFLSCQIDIRLRKDRKGMQRTLEKVVQLFEDGKLSPIPVKMYHIADYLEAFRMMAKGQHIGKVVFDVGDYIPEKFDLHGDIFHENATYLVTGAFGGVGQALVRWMQKMGAKHLVMVSRSGAKSASAHRTLKFLKHKGVEVHSFAADVSEYKNVKRVLDNIRSDPGIPPLRGIFHLAGVIDETLLPDLTPEQLDFVLQSKAKSAHHLHNLTKNENLDIFFLMSSVSTLRGQSAQPAYCAANSVLDALAEYRHTLGLPALSLQMGAVRGAGHLESRPETAKVLESQGCSTLHINEIMELLGSLLNGYSKPVVCFAYQDWTTTAKFTHRTNLKFRHLMDDASLNKADCQLSLEDLESMVKQKLGQMICQSPEDIDITKPMIDYGVDSLMAVEMVTWASKELNVVISQLDILGGISTSVLLEKAVENTVVLPLMEH
ncbi:probable polyketide synthase 1 [Ptychodera flava]|uniref:probable polyketide synthase 1 n=1 Tax=Ptychodera flava TaxID=63121 RepID=UPI00396A07E4